MKSVIAKDGTKIAYEVSGEGPALVLVDGGLCYHESGPGPKIVKELAQSFTTYLYDRRGRGESGDTQPYAMQREIEDLEAIIKVAGGSAFVFGQSSGAVLSLEAARILGPEAITKLALYEAPMFNDTRIARTSVEDYRLVLRLADEGRRADVLTLFLTRVGVPFLFRMLIRVSPIWPKLMSIADTVAYDFAIVSPYQGGAPLSKEYWSRVTVPVWVAGGSKSTGMMQDAQKRLADTLPRAEHHILPGQTHAVTPEVIAPELVRFFTSA